MYLMKKIAPIIISFTLFVFSNSYSQKTNSLETLQVEITNLINQTKHSIVTVSSISTHSYTIDKNEGFISLFGNNVEERKGKLWIIGSGIIYNEQGYIITKSSTLSNFEEIKVTLCDSTEYDAKFIGNDEATGLAVIKIEAENLKPATLGNSDDVPVYSMVYIVGNSMGISSYASFGIINSITSDKVFIISAPINPGSNGAGVFNLKGELIGLISAQITPNVSSASFANFNYSIQNGLAASSNRLQQITNEIIQFHLQPIGWLGIDLDVDSLASGKIIVSHIIPGSPAQKSGLKTGDWLLKYNESFFKSLDQFANLIEKTKPGTIISIDFIRAGRPLKVFPRITNKKRSVINPQKSAKSSTDFSSYSSRISQQQKIVDEEILLQLLNRINALENEVSVLKSKLKKVPQ